MANADPRHFSLEIVEESNVIPKEFDLEPCTEEIAAEGFVKFKVHNFSSLKDVKKQYFEGLKLAGKEWRLLIFPLGNQSEHVSIYLDFCGPKVGKWSTCAYFSVTLIGEDTNHFKDTHHRFTDDEIDWGFTSFIPKKIFYNEEPGKRVLIDDTLTATISLKIVKDPTGILWHNFVNYDSKEETGYVGLKNQGATCYMNSILQSLYFTKYLRRAVFRMPTDDDDPAKSIPLALQRVFYHLQYSSKPVGTTELTKSFGWDAVDSFMQHDVQEFNRVLCDKLETKMKGTPVEGAINFLLEGKMKSFVRCTDVQFESSREESFYDVQLNVKGFKNLKASFDDYIQVETLDGDNKYQAEGFGLQRATKGIIFKRFPPVLHLQLKRFEYDMMKDAMVKINDRHEFPESIDLSDYLEESERKEPQIYHLHGVLVHSGDLHGGHYCAFIRPEKEGDWFKFDDDRVTRCLAREAMDENFGIDPEDRLKESPTKPTSRFSKKFTNAYMLVYIRESDIDQVLCPVDESDIYQSAKDRFALEQLLEEQKRKEKEEQHLYMQVRLVTKGIIEHHHVTDLCVFDAKTESPASALTLRIKKDLPFTEFKNLVAEKTGIPLERQRLWAMSKRQNGTIRPDEILEGYDKESMAQIKELLKITVDLRIFVEEGLPLEAMEEDDPKVSRLEPYHPATHFLLFVKSYDPQHSALNYHGHYIMALTEKPSDLIARINARNGWAPNTPLKLFEEIRPTMVEPIKTNSPFQKLEIGTGDIICYMKEIPPEEAKDYELPTASKYYDHILNSITVHFRDRMAPKDLSKHHSLLLSKKMRYEVVANLVAKQLGTEPLMIRFTSHNNYTDGPKLEFKYEPDKLLEEMLQPNTYQPMVDILYYEKLDIPVTELERKRSVTVSFLNSKMVEEGPFKLLVNKDDTVEQLVEVMKTKLKIPAPATPSMDGSPKDSDAEMKDTAPSAADAEPHSSGLYRLVEVYNHRISKIYHRDEPVRALNEYNSFYVEEIPSDQLHPGDHDQLVNVCHFHKDPYSSHGTPFVFLLKAGEEFKDTFVRLQKKLCLSDKEFEKFKFAIISYGKARYFTIEDNPVLASWKFGISEYFGLDHVDKTPKQSRSPYERAIVIRN